MRGFRALIICLACTLAIIGWVFLPASVKPHPGFQNDEGIPRGAALYDDWPAELGVKVPENNHPIWSTQSTNTRSGSDTWRCVTCHGWDYLGKDGAYGRGSNYTGFPNVYQSSQEKSAEELIGILTGVENNAHDFSNFLNQQNLEDLANFLKNGLVVDAEYIDPVTFKVIGGNPDLGKDYYDQVCSSCHGIDGTTIMFRFEGRNASLGTLAVLDPWRFLHKTRFGTPGTEMPIGYLLGWTAAEGRDVLLHVQSMPTGLEPGETGETMTGELDEENKLRGGPAQNIFTGILTALGAMAGWLGFAVIVGAVLVGIIMLVILALRGQSSK